MGTVLQLRWEILYYCIGHALERKERGPVYKDEYTELCLVQTVDQSSLVLVLEGLNKPNRIWSFLES